MSSAKNFLIITSIFPPTEAVQLFAKVQDWQLVVVGDKKTPQDWQHQGVTYLGPEAQEALGFETTKLLPWNHYCRKMVGYLYAMQQGATCIADSDDDNLPLKNWPLVPTSDTKARLVAGKKFVNIYKYFTDEFIWPRGLPLNYILDKAEAQESITAADAAIWQGLANEDPDVDAIYRLTNNKPIDFDEDAKPVVLNENCATPFNSQNTIFGQEAFALLYLPAFVTFRFTDILRGLVAQPLLWASNKRLGFTTASVVQKRNPHDYMKDFESEIPVYTQSERVIEIVQSAINASNSLAQNLELAYEALKAEGIVDDKEVALVRAWAKDVMNLSGDPK